MKLSATICFLCKLVPVLVDFSDVLCCGFFFFCLFIYLFFSISDLGFLWLVLGENNNNNNKQKNALGVEGRNRRGVLKDIGNLVANQADLGVNANVCKPNTRWWWFHINFIKIKLLPHVYLFFSSFLFLILFFFFGYRSQAIAQVLAEKNKVHFCLSLLLFVKVSKDFQVYISF